MITSFRALDLRIVHSPLFLTFGIFDSANMMGTALSGIGDNHLPLKFLTEEFVDKVLSVNLKALMLFLAALENSSFYAVPTHTLYSATKGGLTAFVKVAAADLSGKRIRVKS